MNKQTIRALIAAPVLALAAGGFVATQAAEPASAVAPAPGYGPGYPMGPGMMGGYGPGAAASAPGRAGYGPGAGYHRRGPGGYGPGASGRGDGYGGPWMMGDDYGGYGMGWGMMGGGYGMGPSMMGGYGRFAAGLNLSDAQQKKIAAIEDAQFKKQWALMPQMRAAMVDYSRDVIGTEINVDAAMKAAKAVDGLRLQMLRNHLETTNQINAVLTKEQRVQLQRFRPWNSR